jgi:hypothetical protein
MYNNNYVPYLSSLTIVIEGRRSGSDATIPYVQQDFDFAAKRTSLVQLELVTSSSGLFDEKYLAKTLVKSKGQYLDS